MSDVFLDTESRVSERRTRRRVVHTRTFAWSRTLLIRKRSWSSTRTTGCCSRTSFQGANLRRYGIRVRALVRFGCLLGLAVFIPLRSLIGIQVRSSSTLYSSPRSPVISITAVISVTSSIVTAVAASRGALNVERRRTLKFKECIIRVICQNYSKSDESKFDVGDQSTTSMTPNRYTYLKIYTSEYERRKNLLDLAGGNMAAHSSATTP